MSRAVERPGVASGPYPERPTSQESWFDRVLRGLTPNLAFGPTPRRLRRFVREVEESGAGLADLGDDALRSRALELGQQLVVEGMRDPLLAAGFALVREAARRTLGTPHYDVQLMGGYVMTRGRIAEMATGEGKTLTATLPASVAALAGIPVHVLSVNDYLVERDAASMRPLYESLGLSVGTVLGSERDPAQRRAAYACDITYVTGQQVTFDYLRDRLVRGARVGPLSLRISKMRGDGSAREALLLRGLCYGIIDEADSVLVDEARTPLILSGPDGNAGGEMAALYSAALTQARSMRPGRDFRVERAENRVELTVRGLESLEAMGDSGVPGLAGPADQEEWITRALSALHLYRRDHEYLVRDGKVEIVDPGTGRILEGRSWEAGLHQLVELKEGCELTAERNTLARISYQRFYRRYRRLGGMTGTAREVSRELRAVYGLPTCRIPTRKPIQRRHLGTRVYATADEKWQAAAARVAEVHETGRPVLVGTGSVADSEALGAVLASKGLEPRILNARHDAAEAEIVAGAGERGCITVATHMAGRGTDIQLGAGVEALGGLHVLATERAEAGRIDRQLAGRSGRQGEAGSFESILSLEDEAVLRRLPEPLIERVKALGRPGNSLPPLLGTPLTRAAQMADEAQAAGLRRAVMEMEDSLADLLAFAGPGE